MKKWISIFFFISFCVTFLNTFCSKPVSYDETYLEDAFKTNDTIKLEMFFNNWYELSQPINKMQYNALDDTIKNAYTLYQLFYNPYDLFELTHDSLYIGLYDDINYCVVQNVLKVMVVDYLDFNHFDPERYRDKTCYVNEINNFRPKLDSMRVIYQSDSFKKIIDQFIQYDSVLDTSLTIKEYYEKRNIISSKIHFLQRFIKILPSHWGDYLFITTHPYVYDVIFDSRMDLAIVEYRCEWQGGEALYQKKNGKWRKIKSFLTWME